MVRNSYEIGDILVQTTKKKPIPKSLRDAIVEDLDIYRIVSIENLMIDKDNITFVDVVMVQNNQYKISIPLMFLDNMFINFGKADNMELLWSRR